MAAPTLLNLANTPRDYEGILAIHRPIRFRIALQMGLPSTTDKKGFAAMPDEQQANELLAAIIIHDDPQQACPCKVCEKVRADAEQAPEAQQQAVVATQVAAATPMAAPQPGAPAVPTAAASSPAFAPPPPVQQQQQQQQPPQQQQQQQPAARAPVTQAQVAQAAGPPSKTSPVQKLLESLQKQQKKVLDELEGCAGVAELEELKELNLGMARMMNVMCIVLLDLSAAVMEIPKEDLITMANVALDAGEPEKFFAEDEGTGGK